VHIYGHPADLAELLEVCREFELPLVEDAAESLGSWYRDRPAGSFGRIAALSFNGNKIVTTGGGGALLTDDVALADRAKHLTTTAKQAHVWRFDHDMVGWNYRLPNINAALGCAQLEQLPDFVAQKRALAHRYAEEFADHPYVEFVHEPPGSRSNYWLSSLMLKSRDLPLSAILTELHGVGIAARPAWTPMHRLPMYAAAPRADLRVAEDLADRLINLPSGIKVARALRGPLEA
ncbi:MAG: DegT/DnrJ/EryC1/StrS family aminotransferase, partial [Longimicrobiales bacterium]